MQDRISADNLCKKYDGQPALDHVSLVAREGECLGIFGRSGAGKSVLLRLLAGMERPDSGAVFIAGGTTAVLHTSAPQGDLTPMELLWLHATLYGIPRGKRYASVRELLALVDLDSERDRRIKSLPTGSHKLLGIACTLLSPSDLLLLDEPMSGLDFGMRSRIWEHLLSLRTRDRKTILVATSRPEDAEICDSLILIHQGRVIAAGTAAELRARSSQEAVVIQPVRKAAPSSKSVAVIAREQDGELTIEQNTLSCPAGLLKHISQDSVVRIMTGGLDSILDELIADGRENSRSHNL